MTDPTKDIIANPPEPDTPEGDTSFARTKRAIGPVLGGVALDLADAATFGPVGVGGGFLLGAAVGMLVGGVYGFGWKGRFATALAAAAYTATPFTAALPLATVLGALLRFKGQPASTPQAEAADDTIDVKAEVVEKE
jgi:hypothetical protein